MSGNEKQRDYWNGDVASNWVKRLNHFERSLTALSLVLMDFAAPQKGEAVLDIGCGAGTTTELAADLVAPGMAAGLDISAPLLAAARNRCPAIDFIEADAADYPFKPEFDLVISRLGVMFFVDPVKAFANIRKAMKPGGRLAFICWQSQYEICYLSEPFKAAHHLLPQVDPTPENEPGPFGLADPVRTENILKEAGWQDIRIEAAMPRSLLGTTLEEAVDQAMNMGPLGRLARQADEETIVKIRDAIAPVLAQYRTENGIEPVAACWLVGARA